MKSNIEFFEKRIGGSFHYENYWMDKYVWEIRTKVFFNNIDVDNKFVLDFGCGGGEWGREMLNTGAFVWGTEQSRNLASKAGIPCHVGTKNYADKSFDMITAITSLNFTVPMERKNILKEFYRILKPKGIVAIIDNLPNQVPSFQQNLIYKEIWTPLQWKIKFFRERFLLEKNIPISWVDTTIFHYLGGNRFTYWITKYLDTHFMFEPKYRLLVFRKI